MSNTVLYPFFVLLHTESAAIRQASSGIWLADLETEVGEVENFLTRCGKVGVAKGGVNAAAFTFVANLTKEPTGTALALAPGVVERGFLIGRATLASEVLEPEREDDRLSTFPLDPFSIGLVCKNGI